MKLDFRGKLFWASVSVVVLVVFATGIYLEDRLRERYRLDAQETLRAKAEMLRISINKSHLSKGIPVVDKWADSFGKASQTRVTLIGSDGRVLGDSSVEISQISALENHGSRPEVVRARERGYGVSSRYSTTLRKDMLYLALHAPELDLVVRLSRSMGDLSLKLNELRLQLVLAGFLGLSVAVFGAAVVSQLVSRRLRGLVKTTQRLASGEKEGHVKVEASDELGLLAGSFNELSDTLHRTTTDMAHTRERLESILEGMQEAVVAVDSKDRINLINRSALKLFGLQKPPKGVRVDRIIRAPELNTLLVKTRSDGQARAEFHLSQTPLQIVEITSAVSSFEKTIVLAIRDVTELRRLEQVRQDFVASVSHELRTPVSIIRANAEMLLDGALEESELANQFVEGIERHAIRMARIIAELLDLARLDAQAHHLDQIPLQISEAVSNVELLLEQPLSAKNVTVQLDSSVGQSILADPNAFEKVLFNLIENALKFTPLDGKVHIVARTKGAMTRIEINDEGPGIPMAHRDRIFERFYRVDPSRSREMGGTGLGLALVRNLVTSMGGEVGVGDSEYGGASFWLELPTA